MIAFNLVQTQEQLEWTAGLAGQIWREHYGVMLDSGQIEYMLDKFQSPEAIKQAIVDGYEYYLWMENQQPIGYLAVQPQPDGTLCLSKFYVHQDYRGKGYARQAFEFVKELSKERGYSQIWLTVNVNNHGSIQVYHKLGMRLLRTQIVDIGQGYVMDDEVYAYDL